MSKRAQRRFDAYNKYKGRLKEWMNWTNPNDPVESWRDLKDREWKKFLKDTPHPCSCPACSGERYKRNKKRQEDQRIIKDQLKEWDDRYDEFEYLDDYDYWDAWNEWQESDFLNYKRMS